MPHVCRLQLSSLLYELLSVNTSATSTVKPRKRMDDAANVLSLFFSSYLPAALFIIFSNALWEVSVEVEKRRPPLSGGLVLWKV